MTARFIIGDVRQVLATMPDASVDLIVTSPPFLALRSYLPADHPDKALEIGSEATPAEFLDVLLGLTAEWRRLLTPHGSIAVELGDTYSGAGGYGSEDSPNPAYGAPRFEERFTGRTAKRFKRKDDGWPEAKSLTFIPELYGIALAYGINPLTGAESPAGRWRVRNKVAWCRPNPPVGALGDKFRPGTSYITVACVARDRWFDLEELRTPHVNPRPQDTNGEKAEAAADLGIGRFTKRTVDPAGAPPLDWWNIPTQPYWTPDGLIIPAGGTFHQVRVPVGVPGDGIQRTTSPSCPVHGSTDHPGSSAPDDAHAADGLNHNGHTVDRHAPEQLPGSPPTPEPTDPTGLFGDLGDLAATPRNTASSRTVPAPATPPAGTPSAGTDVGTARTSTSPVSSALHHDTPESSSAQDDSPGGHPGTDSRTAGIPDPSSPCSCSYWIELPVASESTSDYATYPDHWKIPTQPVKLAHYATFPEELPRRLILAMCPSSVCRECGKPRRRVVETTPSPHLESARALSREHNLNGPPPGPRYTSESVTLGWTDCGCCCGRCDACDPPIIGGPWPCRDKWRPGIVLDPFAGSGTTLAVAQGLGRDSIGIDLDDHNADLARERVGMFLEVEHKERAA